VKLSGFTSTAESGTFINAPNSSVSNIVIIWNYVTVESCSATSATKGGLIYVANSNLNITIGNSVISGISVKFDILLFKRFFYYETCSSACEGGVIFIQSSNGLYLTSSSFSNVTCKQGGFVYVNNTANVVVSSCTFNNGSATSGYAGAVCVVMIIK
jgi:hypothetical protein